MWEKRLHPENKNKKNVIKETTEKKEENLLLWNKEKKNSWKKNSVKVFLELSRNSASTGHLQSKKKNSRREKMEHSGNIEELLKVKSIIRNEKFGREIRR